MFLNRNKFLRNTLVLTANFTQRNCCKINPKMANNLQVALIQSLVETDLMRNLENANDLIAEARSEGARLVALPECFNSPYGTNFFKQYAENIPKGHTSQMLSKAAKDHKIYLVGGTIPELDYGKWYNTCTVWNPEGELIAKYRKMHLFDINIPHEITFKESEVLSAGNELATFKVDGIQVGLGICYDLRFEELAKLYRLQHCKLLIYPGAFNMTTGPLHWEILQRARALDNATYVLSISPARGQKGYIAYGHSQVTNPWGKVIAQAKAEPQILYANLDLTECDKIRQQIPVFAHRRTDIYDTILVKQEE